MVLWVYCYKLVVFSSRVVLGIIGAGFFGLLLGWVDVLLGYGGSYKGLWDLELYFSLRFVLSIQDRVFFVYILYFCSIEGINIEFHHCRRALPLISLFTSSLPEF